MIEFEFEVEGLPAPKGSAKAFVRNGRANIVQTNANALYEWQARIGLAARQAGVTLTDGPVVIEAGFYFARPKSHWNKLGIKDTAPKWHTQRPDADKLLRSVLDALTNIAYPDDCAVVIAQAAKFWSNKNYAIISVHSRQDSTFDGKNHPIPGKKSRNDSRAVSGQKKGGLL